MSAESSHFESMKKFVEEYLTFLSLSKSGSINTQSAYRHDLMTFVAYLIDHQTTDFDLVTSQVIKNFFIDLQRFKNLSNTTLARYGSAIKSFYKYLLANEYVAQNPISGLHNRKVAKKLPAVMTRAQVNKLLSLPKVSEALGLRDKVILELLYACGLRVSELINVKISDIFFDDHLIRVIGKRNKERIVPIHSAALQWIKNYLLNSRPALQKKIQSKNFLLLNRRGTKLSRMGIWMIIDQYTSQLKVKAHPHTFRHTFATHLVEGGADLRSVQEMLGHTDIATTSIYTHIDNAFVKKEHINAHPRGR